MVKYNLHEFFFSNLKMTKFSSCAPAEPAGREGGGREKLNEEDNLQTLTPPVCKNKSSSAGPLMVDP